MKKDSLFRGTVLLSISLLLTKFLGLIYIIPFYQIVGGEEQMALFNYGYSFYAVILEISGAGTPLAIAKLVAKYNALGKYDISKRIVKLGSILLVIMGIIGFSILFFGADFLSEQILISSEQKYTPAEFALVLRSLSFAVPIVLIAAGFKGLFQGHEIMLPTAVGQFVEQAARIIFLIGSSALVIFVFKKGIVLGNVVATLSAAIAAVFSLLVMLYFYNKYKDGLEYRETVAISQKSDVSNGKLMIEFLSVSIPFIFIVGLFPILNVIDQYSFSHAMKSIGASAVVESKFSALQLINKIVMIAVAIAPAFSSTFLPSVTRMYAVGDKEGVSDQINKVILALMMIVLPALVGMYLLADPLYSAFLRRSIEFSNLLRVYLPLAVLFSFYSLTSTIMQAINRQMINLATVVVGVTIKYFTVTPFVIKFQAEGVIYSSVLTYIIMIVMNLIIINLEVRLKIGQFLKNFIILISACAIMFISVAAVYEAIFSNFDINAKAPSMILIVICGMIGAPIYFYTVNKLDFIKFLFGKKLSLKNMIRRKI